MTTTTTALTFSPPPGGLADRGAVLRRLLDAHLAGLAPRTREAYAGDLAALACHRGEPDGTTAVAGLLALPAAEAHAAVLDWRSAMEASGLAPATVNRRLAALRSAWRLARSCGLVADELLVRGPRSEAYRDTRGPGRPTVAEAFRRAGAQRDGYAARRDVALLALLHDLGLRRSEAVGLNLGDVDVVGGRLTLRISKGRREAVTLELPVPTLDALRAWAAIRGAAAPEAPLFVRLDRAGRSGGRLTGRSVARLTHRVAGCRPHGLRHAGATAVAEGTGGDTVALLAWGRWRKLDTARRYVDGAARHQGRAAAVAAAARAVA